MKCQLDKEVFLWVIHRSLYAERSFLRMVSCCQLYSTITRRTRQLENRLQLLCKRPCHFGQELGYPPDIVAKLVSLFEEWRTLLLFSSVRHSSKSGRKSKFQQAKEEVFKEKLKHLFDMAHQNAMKMIKIQEDRDFRNAQRQEDRQ